MTDFRQDNSSDQSDSRNGESTSPAPFESKYYLPVGLNLFGKKILVVGSFTGADENVLELLRKLIQTDATIEVAGHSYGAAIRNLTLTYSHRMRILEKEYDSIISGERSLSDYFLVFAFGTTVRENVKLARKAKSEGVLFSQSGPNLANDFTVPTWLRRGRIKLSISTDGLSPSLEKALMNRISAALVRDIDRYKLYADFVYDRIRQFHDNTTCDTVTKEELIERLCQLDEETYLALARQNFDEATQLFELNLERVKNEMSELAGE
ncbi:MAG: hypothetical protein K2Z81_08685 [Cyanobacteria bacterium]|nr:hypothetical protein [Cyanobacteriota bacterium]